MSLVLALDFGGTKLSAALSAPGERHWRALERQASPPGADRRSDYEIITALARKLLGGARPLAVGASFGGPVLTKANTVRLSHHVPGWENAPLGAWLERDFGAPARIENDGNVASLGEHRYGAGQGVESLLYVTVSTGVGGGWVIGGKVWRGAGGMAGEVGHIRVKGDGPPCVCGSRGCVESLSAGPAIARQARAWLLAQPQRGSVLRDLVEGDVAAVTAKVVGEAAARGDAVARVVLEEAARALGIGLGSAANLMNPERIVIGGGVSKSGEPFWEPLRRAARETAMPEVELELLPALLGDDAPLWGAVALAEAALSEPELEEPS